MLRNRGLHGFLLGALLLAVGGCSEMRALEHRVGIDDAPDPSLTLAIAADAASRNADYTVGPEDVLEISVWKEDTLKKEVLVRPDGGISFPLAGDLKVEGLTTEQIRTALAERLQRYIPEPVVSVVVLKAANYKIYVIGRVNKPGDFTSGRAVDVLQALAMAGGLTPFASERDIHVIRKIDGKATTIPIDYAELRESDGLEQDILLKSGDVVVVP